MHKLLLLVAGAVIIVMLGTSCETMKESSKYKFADGFYSTSNHGKRETVYVLAGTDTIKEYSKVSLRSVNMDTVKSVSLLFPAKKPQ